MARSNARRSEIIGWGADLDVNHRPAVPKEANRESVGDASTDDDRKKIPQQKRRVEILVSTEHKRLTPIFGTACPPKGLSGVFRRIAFQFSEGQKAHWMILILADRIDVYESTLGNFMRGHLHNPLNEMGLKTEFRRGGFRSRFGQHRADTRRWGQQIILASVGIAVFALAYRSKRWR